MTDFHVWLPRALFESVLIVFSILLALGLDQWKEDQEIEALVNRSIASFEREIRANKLRLEDVSAYHRGLEQVLRQQSEDATRRSVKEYRDVMAALDPPAFLSSAWQTALATGGLGRMNYELVSALSLTYGMQQRFDESYQTESRILLAPASLNAETLDLTIFYAARFVADVTRSEAELVVFYDQTLALIDNYKHTHDIDTAS
jgi:hypothetical protein